MTSYVTPKKNSAYVFFTALESQAAAGTFKSSPTLAAGDFKVSIDGGALANLATLPTNTPGGVMVKISLSASEMNGDNITVVCIDAAGAEWYDQLINIQTSAQQIDDLAVAGDEMDLVDAPNATAVTAIRAEIDANSTRLSTIEGYTSLTYSTLTTLSIRVGAWTGTGVNTVLGAFKALLSKTASTPSDIGGTFDPATDSTEALRDRGDAAWVSADVSALATAAALATVDGIVDDILVDTGTTIPGLLAAELSSSSDSTASGAISRTRGNTWTINATIGAITGYTSLWFTVKHSQDDADSDAILQIKLNSSGSDDDLLYVNGATASDSTLGTITVSDASTGAIIIAVDETVTDDMPAGAFYYDVQVLNSGTVTTPDSGTFTITADVTRSIA